MWLCTVVLLSSSAHHAYHYPFLYTQSLFIRPHPSFLHDVSLALSRRVGIILDV